MSPVTWSQLHSLERSCLGEVTGSGRSGLAGRGGLSTAGASCSPHPNVRRKRGIPGQGLQAAISEPEADQVGAQDIMTQF